jgi:hypothetical protein
VGDVVSDDELVADVLFAARRWVELVNEACARGPANMTPAEREGLLRLQKLGPALRGALESLLADDDADYVRRMLGPLPEVRA